MKTWMFEMVAVTLILLIAALLAWRVWSVPVHFGACTMSAVKPYTGVCR